MIVKDISINQIYGAESTTLYEYQFANHFPDIKRKETLPVAESLSQSRKIPTISMS